MTRHRFCVIAMNLFNTGGRAPKIYGWANNIARPWEKCVRGVRICTNQHAGCNVTVITKLRPRPQLIAMHACGAQDEYESSLTMQSTKQNHIRQRFGSLRNSSEC